MVKRAHEGLTTSMEHCLLVDVVVENQPEEEYMEKAQNMGSIVAERTDDTEDFSMERKVALDGNMVGTSEGGDCVATFEAPKVPSMVSLDNLDKEHLVGVGFLSPSMSLQKLWWSNVPMDS